MRPIDLLREIVPYREIVEENDDLCYIQECKSFIWIAIYETRVMIRGKIKPMEDPDFVEWFKEQVNQSLRQVNWWN